MELLSYYLPTEASFFDKSLSTKSACPVAEAWSLFSAVSDVKLSVLETALPAPQLLLRVLLAAVVTLCDVIGSEVTASEFNESVESLLSCSFSLSFSFSDSWKCRWNNKAKPSKYIFCH